MGQQYHICHLDICRVPEWPGCISSGMQEFQESFPWVDQSAHPASLPPVRWSWWSVGNFLQHTPAPNGPREAFQASRKLSTLWTDFPYNTESCQRLRLQLLSGCGPSCTKKKRLPCKGCQITPFLGTVRFSRCIPVGHNFLGSCFRRKAHGGKLQKRKWKTEITVQLQNQTWFFNTNLQTTHQGEPCESDLGCVCMALAPGEINPPVFGGWFQRLMHSWNRTKPC